MKPNASFLLSALASASLLTLSHLPAAQAQPMRTDLTSTQPHAATEPTQQSLPTVQVQASGLELPVDQSTAAVELLEGQDLLIRRASSIGASLDGLENVRNNDYGAGAGRPIIRGMDGPRVRILSDGAEVQDASTSSPDHALAIEPLLATQIEVIRGPSTVLYGGGIGGGVVNVLDGRVPTEKPLKGYKGNVEVQKSTNAREGTGLFSITGGTGPIVVHAEALKRSAQDYSAGKNWSEGRKVIGSNNETWYGSVGASLVQEKGYIGFAYSNLRSKYGLPGHSHEYEGCHPHGNHLHCGSHDDHDHGHGHDEHAHEEEHAHNEHGHEGHDHGHDGHDHDHDHGSEVPMVDMRSQRWDLRGEWRQPVDGIARIKFRSGITDYQHDEIEHGGVGTSFTNKAYDGRLEVEHEAFGPVRGLVGLQLTQRKFAAVGEEDYIQPSKTNNTAIFALEEYKFSEAIRFELGLRQEWQRAKLDETSDSKVKHNMTSVSTGASWDFAPGHILALSLSATERAPTAEELFSNGIHLATNTYERGNPSLKAEKSRNVDISLRKTSGDTRYRLTAFYNRINDYIYASTTDQFEDFRLIDYRQKDAIFKGLEARISQQLNTNWRIGAFGNMVNAKFTNGGGYVPRVPSRRLGVDANWQWNGWAAGAEVYRNYAQNHIADYETRTPAYTMLNLQASYTGRYGDSSDQTWEVFARLDNALNKLAFNHSSFIKNQAPLRGRNLRVGLKVSF